MSSEMDEVINEYITECQEMIQRLSERLSTLEKDPTPQETMRAIARDLHTIKGNSQLFGFLQVGKVSHAMEECLQKLKEAPQDVLPPLIDLLLEGIDLISQLFVSIKSSNTEPPMPEAVGQMCDKCIDFVAKRLAKSQVTRIPEPIDVPNQQAVQEVTQKVKQALDEAPSDTIRVQTEVLDKLMNLTGELVLIRNQLSQLAKSADSDEMMGISQRLHVVSAEMQNDVMKTRMQPIGNILGKFTRIVRDTARSIEKEADLTLSGIETELDKSLIETVRDPLTHIVRNAVDHGIETPAERKKAGKNEVGQISIRAYHEGGHVNIEISDDGRGLSRMKIGSKAIERGLITPEALAKLADRDIFNFIFYPGFSTASKVSSLSGRGVGMDVVRTNIEKIGGSIEISSLAGKGTTFKLRIPLTLAIIPALIIRAGSARFAIPQVNLAEVLQLRKDDPAHPIDMLQGQPVFRLRGQLLPLIKLCTVMCPDKGSIHNIFERKTSLATAQLQSDHIQVVVLTSDECTFGLIVDDIEDSADVVLKPIPNFLKDFGAFSGATILGNGDIALTLDIGGLAKITGLRRLVNHDYSGKESILSNSSIFQNTPSTEKRVTNEFLRVDIRARGPYALPLDSVSRLEEIKSCDVQVSGDQKVVKYRGSLLPLVSVSGALGLSQDWPMTDKIPTVVVRERDRFYGLVVGHIVDIFSSDAELDRDIPKEEGILGSIIDDGEVITMIDAEKIIQKHFRRQLFN
jgi:two-component system chemotaxis sensor kinase CheA